MAFAEDYVDGHMELKLDRILDMETEQKFSNDGIIARFNWKLGALKHNVLNEENSSKPNLFIFVHCTERSKRLDGWSCTARIRFVLKSHRKTIHFDTDNVRFPMPPATSIPCSRTDGVIALYNGMIGVQLPWDKMIQEFGLCADNDWIQITAKISLTEQTGYGSLIRLTSRLRVHDKVIPINKFHLATYSDYFRALFFSNWSQRECDEYELSDPDDDLEAFEQMLAMAYPVEHFPEPSDSKITEVLRLADKYDLSIVIERCERILIGTGWTDEWNVTTANPSSANNACCSGCGTSSNNGSSNSNNGSNFYRLQPPISSNRCCSNKNERSLIQKLALAERYGLFNLKSHCLDRMSPAHFCAELRSNIGVYNHELSDGLKEELEGRMAAKSAEELATAVQQRQESSLQREGTPALPPPHKRVRPRPKTPPRPNYNLPPFRFK